MNNAKSSLRQKIIMERFSLTPQEVEAKSRVIADRILDLPQYNEAGTLLIYLPFKNEVDTVPLIKMSRQNNKRILVPVCRPHYTLLLSEFHDFNELTSNPYGISEPAPEFIRPIPPEEVDLAIIPGVAYDKAGYRLGYGAGYFDRFVSLLRPDCLKVAFIYDLQLLDALPSEAHDLQVDLILTESQIFYPVKS
ncbi:MAG: 5-formyltetrahydrofolate cyclo-ligase [Clostridia bacterium]|jgi:5-formyltetrahydrofolate cyclo-ligase|nr:5-formyltetrahydrofolate cyclo-ligase [Clostridia bacterium]